MNLLLLNTLASFDDDAAPMDDAPMAEIVETTPEAPVADAPVSKDRSFSQDDVNRFVKERLAKDRKNREAEFQTQVSSLENRYEDMLQNNNLQKEDRTKLEGQLADLRTQHHTTEKQLTRELKTTNENWATKYEAAVTKGNEWENRYTESTIMQSLQNAAVSNDAYNPEQIITQLRSKTNLVETTNEEGEGTGNLVPMVEMNVKTEGSEVAEKTQMTPDEAVSYMKKNPSEWGNFFKNNIREGIGSDSSATSGTITGSGTVDHTKLTDEQWFQMRKDNPSALGIEKRQR